MIISIENFGKISSARFDLGDYNIFVGENNSGKTYAMQLIYGVIDFLTSKLRISANIDDRVVNFFNNLPAEINQSNYTTFESYLNYILDQEKNNIVNYIFKKHIPIGRITISLNNFSSKYFIKNVEPSELYKDFSKMSEKDFDIISKFTHFQVSADEKTIATFGMIINPEKCDTKYISEIIRVIMRNYLHMSSSSRRFDNILYLPASRSGLMLLYKHYLEERNNNFIDFQKEDSNFENEYGLTQPVYNFISFLQKYEFSENNAIKNKSIIEFINNHLIDGSLKHSGNSMLYSPRNSDLIIPPYLSSSMINEISPVTQLLTAINRFDYIFYDEIETCQHPLTQIQMARLLVRMVNAGYKMIVSTHSDTMVAAINNLIMLSFAANRDGKADKIGYNSDDFLRTSNIHAYQFINTENGTIVEELDNYSDIGIGFNFSLFSESNRKIYNDAKTILEDN